METLTIHPRNKKQLAALKVIFEEMRIPFEKSETVKGKIPSVAEGLSAVQVGLPQEIPYNEEFEAKMKRAAEDKKEGRYKTIKTVDLWK